MKATDLHDAAVRTSGEIVTDGRSQCLGRLARGLGVLPPDELQVADDDRVEHRDEEQGHEGRHAQAADLGVAERLPQRPAVASAPTTPSVINLPTVPVTWRIAGAANGAFGAGMGDALRTWRQP